MTAEPTRRRVLIVAAASRADAASAIADVLRAEGLTAHVAERADGALDAAREFAADAVMLDLQLQGCSALALARALRKDPRFVSAVLVALTVDAGAECRQRAVAAGFDHVVSEPIATSELIAALRSR